MTREELEIWCRSLEETSLGTLISLLLDLKLELREIPEEVGGKVRWECQYKIDKIVEHLNLRELTTPEPQDVKSLRPKAKSVKTLGGIL
jgi:hypothetical protein